MIESISAVTLVTRDMGRAVRFYETLGFRVKHGGPEATFTSFEAGTGFLNLITRTPGQRLAWWGRIIFYVADVDALYDQALTAGLSPEAAPRDAEWSERYFHIIDPDGHEVSFARPLTGGQ
jgi:catechol 2,3-dioxygenase-like lactoylglutathione lyase family enzyme